MTSEPASATSSEPRPARGRGRPPHAGVEERLLAAARDQLAAHGYAAFSIERAAAVAGVGKASAYRRYRNKADLATAALASAAKPPPAPSGDLRSDLVAYLLTVERSLGPVGIGALGSILGERDDPELLSLHRERVIAPRAAHSRALLRAARERGEIRADADLDSTMQMLIGSLFARMLAGDRRSARRWAQSVVAIALHGIEA